jgi:hypothetical protein
MKFINDKNWGALLLCPIWGVFHGYYWSLLSLVTPISLASTSFFLWIAMVSEHTWIATIFAGIGILSLIGNFFSYWGAIWLMDKVLSLFLHENIYREILPSISSLVFYFIGGVILLIYADMQRYKNNEQKRDKRLAETQRIKWNGVSFVFFIPVVICLQKVTLYLADLVSDLATKFIGA